MKRNKEIFGRLGLVALALLVSSLGAELCVRIVNPQHETTSSPGLYQPDPPGRYRLSPGFEGEVRRPGSFRTSVVINSSGMRGPEVPAKQPGNFRLLALGDSFTFGYGVEVNEPFVSLLAEDFQTEIPLFESLNGGVGGYGLPDNLLWLERYGLELKPDLVLLCIFVGNDILDATEWGRSAMSQGVSAGMPLAGSRRGLSLWLYQHFHFFRLLDKIKPILGLSESANLTYLRTMILTGFDESELTKEGRANNATAISGIANLAAEHHFRLAAVLIPIGFQLDPQGPGTARLFSLAGVDPETYDFEAVNRFFKTTLDEHGIPSLDLTHDLRDPYRKGERLIFPGDGHFTPHGHRLVAAAIARFLRDENLVKRPQTP